MRTSSCILCGDLTEEYPEHLQTFHVVKINLNWLLTQQVENDEVSKTNLNSTLEFVNVDSLPTTPSLPTWLKEEKKIKRKSLIRKVTLDPLDFVQMRKSFSSKKFKFLSEGSISDEVLLQVRRKMNKVGSALTPFRITTRRTPKQKIAPKKIFSVQKTHGCEVCHKKFTRSLELKVHMKIHPEKKNFLCDKCDETFKGKHLLIKHDKIFHPVFGTPQAVYQRPQ